MPNDDTPRLVFRTTQKRVFDDNGVTTPNGVVIIEDAERLAEKFLKKYAHYNPREIETVWHLVIGYPVAMAAMDKHGSP